LPWWRVPRVLRSARRRENPLAGWKEAELYRRGKPWVRWKAGVMNLIAAT
jgi:hypothetical protein